MKAQFVLMVITIFTLQSSFAMDFGQSLNGIELTKSTTLFDDGEIKEKWDKALGSFQFEILSRRDSRELFEIKIQIIQEIEENRHDTDVVYIPYNDFMRIKILPRSTINGEFEKLELLTEVDSFE